MKASALHSEKLSSYNLKVTVSAEISVAVSFSVQQRPGKTHFLRLLAFGPSKSGNPGGEEPVVLCNKCADMTREHFYHTHKYAGLKKEGVRRGGGE